MKKRFFLLGIIFLSVISSTMSFAYTLWDYGYDQKDIPMNTYYFVDSDYSTPIAEAISNWNCSAEFWVDGSCTGGSAPYKNIVYTGEYQDTWVGRIAMEIPSNPSDPNHQAQSFDIYINQILCDSEGTKYKQSVMSHEIGHAFGLNHSTAVAIMNHSRNRNTVYTIQSDDISGLKASWCITE